MRLNIATVGAAYAGDRIRSRDGEVLEVVRLLTVTTV
jgi:hypothetical protein